MTREQMIALVGEPYHLKTDIHSDKLTRDAYCK